MEGFLRKHLPDSTWQNRLIQDGDMRFMEFSALDTERLARMGIEVDRLGPRFVVCMWNQTSDLEIGGYLIVDNLAMGRPSMGGIRMQPEITPASIHNLARGMTLKNAAARLPFGGGKAGIQAPYDLSPSQHYDVIVGFANLLCRYKDIYLPGPDVGTNDEDMKIIATQNGIDHAVSKPVDMGGNRIDQLGAAAGGLVIALESLLDEMPRLRSLPQFTNLNIPHPNELDVLIQGFGAVGAHAARLIKEKIPGSRITGVSDITGYLYSEEGLPVDLLFNLWQVNGVVACSHFLDQVLPKDLSTKYSNSANDLLRESGFCFLPASPIANYLDTDPSTSPSMTVERKGSWSVIIEGANTYSPDPIRKSARSRMERAVYREHGTLIVTDYLVNSGGVIYAAQEQLIKTPMHLRIPKEILGNRDQVDQWLMNHANDLNDLADERRQAAELYRDEVIRRNMHELIELLLSDADMLPCEAAEQISIRRIASSESDRKASDLMVAMPTISSQKTIRQAATLLVEEASPIVAVKTIENDLIGVITEWDITRATAMGYSDDQPLENIMTRLVIAASLDDTILELIRKLEYHEISAMPVVDHGQVVGMITADLLARRSLLGLIQSQLT